MLFHLNVLFYMPEAITETMIFPVNADIIGLIQGIVSGLQPFAQANAVLLNFDSDIKKKEVNYQPDQIISDLTTLVCRIITFTSQDQGVLVEMLESEQLEDQIVVKITNSGVNLTVLGEIMHDIRYHLKSMGQERGSVFQIHIPAKITESHSSAWSGSIDHSMIKPWYSEIRKRLVTYFSDPARFEKAARQIDESEGEFLKNVNDIIIFHLDQEGFGTEHLAKKLALSRTQLFRKLKKVTQMAPGQYIRSVRLQKAKEMLEKSELNVSEVAHRVGFVSNSHFSRAFFRQFGVNPSTLK